MTNPRTSLAFYVIPFCHRGHLCGQNLVSISAPRTSFLRGQCGILSKSADNRGQFADTHFAAFGRAAIVAWRLWLGTQEAEATQLKSSCTIVYRLEDTNQVWPFGCCARKNRSDGYSCLKLRFAKATHKKS